MFENIKKKLKKEETIEEKIEREIKEQHKKMEKKSKERLSREEKIMNCRAVLEECYKFFQNTIIIENSRNAELMSAGLFDNDHRNRIREAAIGMLIAKQAIIKLERINTDGELNSTINQMGMALKQIQRLDDSTSAISYSTRNILKKWYNYPIGENEADKEFYEKITIPQDIRDRIDNDFIMGLIEGDSFDTCLRRSVNKNTNSKMKTDFDLKMEQINEAFSDEDSSKLDEAMKAKFSDPF